jgi:integrase
MAVANATTRKRTRATDSKGRPVKGLYVRSDGAYVAGMTVEGRWTMQVLKGASSLTEARSMQTALVAKHDRGEGVAPSRVTLEDVWRDFSEAFDALVASGDRSPRTLELYKQRWGSHLKERLGKKPAQSIKPADVSALLAHLRNAGLSSWTVNGVFVLLSSILTHAMTRGLIVESPVRRLARSERPRPRNKTEARVLTPEEVERLVAATPELYRAVATLAYTGMRASEVLGLTWEDIDYDAQEIRVRFQLSRASTRKRAERIPLKTDGSRRDVALLPRLADILKAHQKGLAGRTRFRPAAAD